MHTLLFYLVIDTLFSVRQILRNAVSKTYNRNSDLRKEILSLKRNISSAEEAAKEVKAELDAAESKLTLVDGEPVLGENPVRLNRLKSRAEKAKEEVVSLQESLEAKEALLARAADENEVIDVKLVLANYLERVFLIKDRRLNFEVPLPSLWTEFFCCGQDSFGTVGRSESANIVFLV